MKSASLGGMIWPTVAVLFLAAAPPSAASAALGPAPTPQAYLDYVLGRLRAEHINSARLDWPDALARARATTADAKTTADTYPAIEAVVAALGEPHTHFERPAQWALLQAGMEAPGKSVNSAPSGSVRPGRIGLVTVPTHLLDTNAPDDYLSVLSGVVDRLSAKGTCRWIIDLRGNRGGNMYPMVDGVQSLLGPSPYGQFIITHGRREPLEAHSPSHPPSLASQPVAVLTDARTSSSGEMVAIAFAGRDQARRFGQATHGYSTGNITVALPDGAALILTDSAVVDRKGRPYSGPIQPDEVTAETKTLTTAERWLMKQPCKAPPRP